jgi:hypothetical protein
MEPSELIEEYKEAEEKWYHLYETGSLRLTSSRVKQDPIHNLEQEAI